MSERRLLGLGLAALLPTAAYAAAFAIGSGFGPPVMLVGLGGPQSSHSAVGLVLVLGSIVLCPALAALCGVELARRRRLRVAATALVVAAVLLGALALAARLPYAPPTAGGGPMAAARW